MAAADSDKDGAQGNPATSETGVDSAAPLDGDAHDASTAGASGSTETGERATANVGIVTNADATTDNTNLRATIAADTVADASYDGTTTHDRILSDLGIGNDGGNGFSNEDLSHPRLRDDGNHNDDEEDDDGAGSRLVAGAREQELGETAAVDDHGNTGQNAGLMDIITQIKDKVVTGLKAVRERIAGGAAQASAGDARPDDILLDDDVGGNGDQQERKGMLASFMSAINRLSSGKTDTKFNDLDAIMAEDIFIGVPISNSSIEHRIFISSPAEEDASVEPVDDRLSKQDISITHSTVSASDNSKVYGFSGDVEVVGCKLSRAHSGLRCNVGALFAAVNSGQKKGKKKKGDAGLGLVLLEMPWDSNGVEVVSKVYYGDGPQGKVILLGHDSADAKITIAGPNGANAVVLLSDHGPELLSIDDDFPKNCNIVFGEVDSSGTIATKVTLQDVLRRDRGQDLSDMPTDDEDSRQTLRSAVPDRLLGSANSAGSRRNVVGDRQNLSS